jgi:hypothetical protein
MYALYIYSRYDSPFTLLEEVLDIGLDIQKDIFFPYEFLEKISELFLLSKRVIDEMGIESDFISDLTK